MCAFWVCFLVDNVVALIPNNEFQPLCCFYVCALNKTTKIENQQCWQQQQTMLFVNGIKKNVCIASVFFCFMTLFCSFQKMSFNCCTVFMITFWAKHLTLKINDVNNNNKQCCLQMAFKKWLCTASIFLVDNVFHSFQTMIFNHCIVFMFTFKTK